MQQLMLLRQANDLIPKAAWLLVDSRSWGTSDAAFAGCAVAD
jgi:hypothetical protein